MNCRERARERDQPKRRKKDRAFLLRLADSLFTMVHVEMLGSHIEKKSKMGEEKKKVFKSSGEGRVG